MVNYPREKGKKASAVAAAPKPPAVKRAASRRSEAVSARPFIPLLYCLVGILTSGIALFFHPRTPSDYAAPSWKESLPALLGSSAGRISLFANGIACLLVLALSIGRAVAPKSTLGRLPLWNAILVFCIFESVVVSFVVGCMVLPRATLLFSKGKRMAV